MKPVWFLSDVLVDFLASQFSSMMQARWFDPSQTFVVVRTQSLIVAGQTANVWAVQNVLASDVAEPELKLIEMKYRINCNHCMFQLITIKGLLGFY